jgi:Lrp/AsnC family leucine-responsive transcriptional regulator
LDATDAILLAELQRNADRTSRDLGETVGLSAGAVHKRVKRLKAQGYINRTAALLDREKLGLDLLCFLLIRFKNNMGPDNMERLQRAVEGLPEVLECFTVSGANDAIIKAAVSDHNALKRLLRELAQAQDVIDRIETELALEALKSSTELPVPRRDGRA